MNRIMISVGIVDFGIGNHTSVLRSLRKLKYRVFISSSIRKLKTADILILPGVGAFPTAMQKLHELNLVNYLKESAQNNCPIIGICLGMQLLTEGSSELGLTNGLGLVPGHIKQIEKKKWHIGWNTIEVQKKHSILIPFDGDVMYFNHSYAYQGAEEFIIAKSRFCPKGEPIVAAIKKGSIIGFQFHPEKSQVSGEKLLDMVLKESIS